MADRDAVLREIVEREFNRQTAPFTGGNMAYVDLRSGLDRAARAAWDAALEHAAGFIEERGVCWRDKAENALDVARFRECEEIAAAIRQQKSSTTGGKELSP